MGTFDKIATNLKWLPAYLMHRRLSAADLKVQKHVMITVADHFEPCYTGITQKFKSVREQVELVRNWATRYPQTTNDCRDADGHPFKHSYFYPAEHNHPEVLALLAEHCREGWGEIEVHLHHGVERPDTAANTREILEAYRDELVRQGCLSRTEGDNTPRYGFVHGNWTLANCGNGRYCGVDEEMQVLAETGCYADFTMPAAPEPAQVATKVNSIYESTLPFDQQAPQRRGRNLKVGVPPKKFPIMVQGPLMLDFGRGRVMPGIENGEISGSNPATLRRFDLWRQAGVSVAGRPEWCFIKLHCHGMIPRDDSAMLGELKTNFVRKLTELSKTTGEFQLHFVTAREMVNIIVAACDGRTGSPGDFRDYRYKLFGSSRKAEVK
jgi:hypothetical protein